MNDILHLINLVRNSSPTNDSNNVLKNIKSEIKDSKVGLLLEIIENQTVKTNTEAAKFVYNVKPSANKYLKLKQRLREKLIEGIFLAKSKINDKQEIEIQKEEVTKALIIIDELIKFRELNMALNMLNKYIRICEKYKLYDSWIRLLMMQTDVNTDLSNLKEVLHAEVLLKDLNKWLAIETDLLAKSNSERLKNLHRDSFDYTQADISEKLSVFSEVLSSDNANLKAYFYIYENLLYRNSKLYSQTIDAFRDALILLDEEILLKTNRDYIINVHALHICLSGNYTYAIRYINHHLPNFQKYSYSWTNMILLLQAMHLHTDQYQQAYDIYFEVINNPSHKLMPGVTISDFYFLFGQIFEILFICGKIKIQKEMPYKKQNSIVYQKSVSPNYLYYLYLQTTINILEDDTKKLKSNFTQLSYLCNKIESTQKVDDRLFLAVNTLKKFIYYRLKDNKKRAFDESNFLNGLQDGVLSHGFKLGQMEIFPYQASWDMVSEYLISNTR